MELNAAWYAALVLVDVTMMTLEESGASVSGVIVFAPALAEGVVEDFIVAICACCLMASASASFRYLL